MQYISVRDKQTKQSSAILFFKANFQLSKLTDNSNEGNLQMQTNYLKIIKAEKRKKNYQLTSIRR